MKKKEKKEKLKIDLFNLEREKISAQAIGNVLGGGSLTLCLCQSASGGQDDGNQYLR